jgi:hypothetical protein
MNQRIRELAEQAQKVSYYTDGGYTPIMTLDQEKFAELIVKECMACSIWVGKINTNSVEPIHTAYAINQRIKQHFGVKGDEE